MPSYQLALVDHFNICDILDCKHSLHVIPSPKISMPEFAPHHDDVTR